MIARPSTYTEYADLCDSREIEPLLDKENFKTSMDDFKKIAQIVRNDNCQTTRETIVTPQHEELYEHFSELLKFPDPKREGKMIRVQPYCDEIQEEMERGRKALQEDIS